MKTYIINGQKVFDYSSNPEPPAWHAKLAQLDPAVGESRTVVTPAPATCPPPPSPPVVGTSEWMHQQVEARRAAEAEAVATPTPMEAVQAAHIARYNDGNLREAILQLEKAQSEVYQIAEQMLYEHESGFYHYAATGSGDYEKYQDGTPWAERRAFLTEITRRYTFKGIARAMAEQWSQAAYDAAAARRRRQCSN